MIQDGGGDGDDSSSEASGSRRGSVISLAAADNTTNEDKSDNEHQVDAEDDEVGSTVATNQSLAAINAVKNASHKDNDTATAEESELKNLHDLGQYYLTGLFQLVIRFPTLPFESAIKSSINKLVL
jgi:hypothetical protein